ncbi:unnamed protein product [Fraxinus pennsylvanica]|uniref:Uncharacterized protein n=1 Tax=Fraxinus pennsylvanica TaxID=56036 RepID=A0AAD2DI18_9LAMI|nr:unnamed protein product [Fraxinus pennsylvanica]
MKLISGCWRCYWNLGAKLKFRRKIGSCSFGELYLVTFSFLRANIQNGEEVGVKLPSGDPYSNARGSQGFYGILLCWWYWKRQKTNFWQRHSSCYSIATSLVTLIIGIEKARKTNLHLMSKPVLGSDVMAIRHQDK